MSKVWVFGAGFSSFGLLDYCERFLQTHVQLTLCDRDPIALQKAKAKFGYVHTRTLDLADSEKLASICQEADIVISLLPPALHMRLAPFAIAGNAHFMTASYLSDEMKALDQEAKDRSLYQMHECGLDPGLDHVLTSMMVEELTQKGFGKIRSLQSYFGGLPARRTVNPWGYLFFWNPFNVVRAGEEGASWLYEGKAQEAAYPDLFKAHFPLDGPLAQTHEVYPNRNSLAYIEKYGLTDATEILRGTIRFSGFMEHWLVLAELMDRPTPKTESNMLSWDDILRLYDWQPDLYDPYWTSLGITETKAIPAVLPKYSFTDGFGRWLLACLSEHWKASAQDFDQVVGHIQLTGENEAGQEACLTIEFQQQGNEQLSAMSKMVGYSMGTALRAVVENKLEHYGIVWPYANALSKEMEEVVNLLELDIP